MDCALELVEIQILAAVIHVLDVQLLVEMDVRDVLVGVLRVALVAVAMLAVPVVEMLVLDNVAPGVLVGVRQHV